MSELQEEERQVLESIYGLDNCFSQLEENHFVITIRDDESYAQAFTSMLIWY